MIDEVWSFGWWLGIHLIQFLGTDEMMGIQPLVEPWGSNVGTIAIYAGGLCGTIPMINLGYLYRI